MNEMEEKLEQILNDPGTMEQIMALARSLSGGESPCPDKAPGPPSVSPSIPDPALLSGLLGMLSEESRGDDPRSTLLESLRPFLREQRQPALDKAIRIARLSRLIRMALVLLGTKEDGHV